MSSGNLRKGLPAQWQSNTAVEAQYRGESPLFTSHFQLLLQCLCSCWFQRSWFLINGETEKLNVIISTISDAVHMKEMCRKQAYSL